MKIKTDYEHGEAITAGKEYDVVDYFPSEHGRLHDAAHILDDEEFRIYVLIDIECAHLGGEGIWEAVE